MIRTLLCVACLVAFLPVAMADDYRVLPDEMEDTTPQQMMHDYLMGLAYQAFDRRTAAYEELETPEQLAAHQKRMRQFFVDQLGGFFDRTPLNPRIVGRVDRDGYRIEKVIFQSQPRHYVTALMYLPDAEPPYPGVLFPCGHSANGKASEAYQLACALLATNGMAVLCYDPIDQGERYMLLDESGKPRTGGTMGHCLTGVGSILLGRNTASYRCWDGIRALDYLAARPEVDPQRIGCTGNSGGGTMTSYLMALDERIRVAAPSCYLTTFRRLMETIGGQDAEQNIHAQIGFGMDHADYVMMRAPKPTLMCTATHDFFDIDGSWDCFRQAKRFYTRLGFGERVDLIETDAKHGFSTQLRVGAVRWMRRWLLEIDDAVTGPELPTLPDEQLQCTPDGQVMLLDGARSVYDLNAEREAQLAAAREKLRQRTDREELLGRVRGIAGIRSLEELAKPECEVLKSVESDGYRLDELVIRPEPGIWLPGLAFVPPEHDGRAYLYLNAAGKQADAQPDGPILELVRAGHIVLAVDLRGIGETAGKGGNQKYAKYLGPEWVDISLAYLLGKSYPAMRAEDTMAAARFLADYESQDGPNRVYLISIGPVGPSALHAAALEPELFASVELRDCLDSWSAVVHEPWARNQYINVVHGALTVYDLPDLVKTLPEGTIEVVNPLNAIGEAVAE